MSAMRIAPRVCAGDVRRALDEVRDPCSVAAGEPLGLDEMGLVESVEIEGECVRVALRLTSPSCLMHGVFLDEIERKVGVLAGVGAVETSFDAGLDWDPTMIREDIRQARLRRLRERLAQARQPTPR
jgi:metal-sulfur cluster biosynthetic enzyme